MKRYMDHDDRTENADRESDGTRNLKANQGSTPSRSLDIYFQEINRTPLLTREEERDLARRGRAGEKGAMDRLVRANLRFVVSIAKQYANQGLSLEDLINEGNLGLIKAAHRFNEERGFKFISYAVWWIRQGILQALADQSRIVRLPLNRAGTLYRIHRASREIEQELGRTPTPDEIAARLDVPAHEVLGTMFISNTHVSLDDPYSADNDDTLVDHLPAEGQSAPDEPTYNAALSHDLERALETLPEREGLVLTLYFGLRGREPMTLDAIGDELHLTRERIRQIKEKAIDRLRRSHRSQFLQSHNDSAPSRSTILRVVLLGVLAAASVIPHTASADWPQFGRAISTASDDQSGPGIVPDGAGGALIVWRDSRSLSLNIDVHHVLASGEMDLVWPGDGRAVLTDALALSIVPQGKEFPAIVSDGAGGAIVTWPDARSILNGLDIYAQHILASGNLDRAWPANGVTVCSVTGEQIAPVIVADGAGGAVIAWVDNRAGATVNDSDVFAQRVLASGLVDARWPVNGRAVSRAPKTQFGLGIVGDNAGGIIVTWTDTRSGNPGSDVFAAHVFGSGVVDPLWPVDGAGLCTAPGSQTAASVISDGTSGAIVAWTDTRDGTNEIFAQRVLISSAIATGWPINGRLVSIGGVDEVTPTLAPDGAHGAIVAWGGGPSGHHNMLAQHVLAAGVIDAAWPVGGASLSFASSEQTSQKMVSDGAGGAIVTWQQGGFDIFAQRVLASGAIDPAYPRNGRPLANIPDLQQTPAIVASGAGGAIVTWMDKRNGKDFDIYAMQVLEALPTGVRDTTPSFTFASPSPNPASATATLRFDLPRESSVRLSIYDVAGRRVRELDSGVRTAGDHAITWDLRDTSGRAVASGVYFARLEVEGRAATRKIMTLK